MTETYVSLALRYRPRKLSEVVGQVDAVRTIRGMIKGNKIPSTILISGPYGTGKTTLARLVARYANCERTDPDTCGVDTDVCDSCVLFVGTTHPDLHEINSADMRGIDDVRGLARVAGFAPQFKRRVYILDESQANTPDAWKAALKLLEEPPPKTMFIMASNERQKFPPTILTRCLEIELRSVLTSDLAKHIHRVSKAEGVELPKAACFSVAEAADGHVRNALQLLEKILLHISAGGDAATANLAKIAEEALGMPPERLVLSYLKAMIDGDAATMLNVVHDPGLQSAATFLGMIINGVRQLLMVTIAKINTDPKWTRIASEISATDWKAHQYRDALSHLLEAYAAIKTYVTPEREQLVLASLRLAPAA